MRLILSLLALAVTTPTVAQTPPGQPWPGATVGDQHRHAMDRLRAAAEAQEALARQQRLETRLTVLELQAARQPASAPDWLQAAPRAPEQERAAREAATARRQQSETDVGQIDAWLYRPPSQTSSQSAP